RYSRQKEAARGCGGRGVLWEFNGFLPETPCQTGTLAKWLSLMLIDVELLSPVILRRRHPFFKRAVPTPVSIHAAASAARAASSQLPKTSTPLTALPLLSTTVTVHVAVVLPRLRLILEMCTGIRFCALVPVTALASLDGALRFPF